MQPNTDSLLVYSLPILQSTTEKYLCKTGSHIPTFSPTTGCQSYTLMHGSSHLMSPITQENCT